MSFREARSTLTARGENAALAAIRAANAVVVEAADAILAYIYDGPYAHLLVGTNEVQNLEDLRETRDEAQVAVDAARESGDDNALNPGGDHPARVALDAAQAEVDALQASIDARRAGWAAIRDEYIADSAALDKVYEEAKAAQAALYRKYRNLYS